MAPAHRVHPRAFFACNREAVVLEQTENIAARARAPEIRPASGEQVRFGMQDEPSPAMPGSLIVSCFVAGPDQACFPLVPVAGNRTFMGLSSSADCRFIVFNNTRANKADSASCGCIFSE